MQVGMALTPNSLARRKPGVQIPSPPPPQSPGHRPGGSPPPGRRRSRRPCRAANGQQPRTTRPPLLLCGCRAVLEDGRDLPTVAGVPERSTFHWAELHQAMEAIPAGRWTTYGDLAALVGTAPQPLGQHIQRCPECPNFQRVLGADGKPRPGFSLVDPNENRSQQDLLESEGVRFSNGAADPRRHLDTAALAAFVGQT